MKHGMQMSEAVVPTIDDVRAAEKVIRSHLSPTPLVRSYALERALGLEAGRCVWLKDFGWTPVGSFKVLGALNWMHNHAVEIGDRPVATQSSGNFASGIAFAGQRYGKRVIIVMPDTAPKVKFALTRSFGAEIRTYDIATDHLTGIREALTRQIAIEEGGVQASPYDDAHVIAGNGVGGLEVVQQLQREGRAVSHFVSAVSGGGLMAGLALAIADGFPQAEIIGVEPAGADDFRQSLAAKQRVRVERPVSFCDGLLSYDVGKLNWPILQRLVRKSVAVSDEATRAALGWLYRSHGLRVEPSGGITVAAGLQEQIDFSGTGDVVFVISGRNVDEDRFAQYIVQND
jgi:threonine dehydratase